MAGYERLKSVGGGGRYDALASDGRTTYPGVGVSFGVSRTLIPLISDGVLAGSRAGAERRARRAARRGVARRPATRSRSGCARGASPPRSPPAPQKYGKQIRYAERRGIPFVWFPADRTTRPHEVKDIRSGDQAEADPDAWRPPAADLRPGVVSR